MGVAGGDADRALLKKKRKQTGSPSTAKNGHASAAGSKKKDEKIPHAGEDGVDSAKVCVGF